MRVCLYQNYSKNNQPLFDLTVGNHLKYCAVNEYTALFDNGPYSPYLNIHLIQALLQEYDFVFTAGSDCVFSNSTRIETFLDDKHDVGIQEEGTRASWLNGEVNLFRASDACMEYLDRLYIEQENDKDQKLGTQTVLNRVLSSGEPWTKVVQVLPPGTIQRFLLIRRMRFAPYAWKEGTLIAHAITGSLEEKIQACRTFMESGAVKL